MSEPMKHYSPFAPLLLGILTLVLWFGFQTVQLLKERNSLATLRTNQTTIYGNAQKMRAQLDVLANETAKLAQAGNAHAAAIVNALKQRGISIGANKAMPPAQAPKSP